MIEHLRSAWKWVLALGLSLGVALLAFVAQRRRLDTSTAEAQRKAEEQRRAAAEIMARGARDARQAEGRREAEARVAEIERRTVEALSKPEPTTDDANALLARLRKGPPS